MSDILFSSLGLKEPLVRALEDLGYEHPTLIQQKAIPLLLETPSDLIALAQTGTGKTAAFGLPLLSYITAQGRDTEALVLCPTRELCLQITENLTHFSKYLPDINIVSVYGGAPIGRQVSALRKGAHIIVATPGRLKDLSDRGVLHLDTVRYVVLDEADEMLNMGFREDIYEIFEWLPEEKRVWLFSATMLPDIKKLTKNIMHQPKEVAVTPANTSNKNIMHRYFLVKRDARYEAMKRLLLSLEDFYILIFCRTKNDTQEVARRLKVDGFEVDYLNGDMAQNEREAIMYKYKNRLINILVATDVAARGIDVTGITHVINFELPDDLEVYTHRSGRTARAGKVGFCYSLVTPVEARKIKRIEQYSKAQIQQEQIPTPEVITQALMQQALGKIHRLIASARTENALSFAGLGDEIKEQYEKEDLLQALLQQLLGEKLKIYQKEKDINVSSRDKTKYERVSVRSYEGGKRDFGGQEEMQKMFINVGRKDGLDKFSFLEWMSKSAAIPKKMIGKIYLKDTVTFFDLEENKVERVCEKMDQKQLKGRKIRIEPVAN